MTLTSDGAAAYPNNLPVDKADVRALWAAADGEISAERNARAAADTDLRNQIAAFEAGMRIVGDWDPATGAFPTTPAPIGAGDQWNVAGSGTIDGVSFAPGDIITAITASPSSTTYAGNWSKRNGTPTSADQITIQGTAATVQDFIQATNLSGRAQAMATDIQPDIQYLTVGGLRYVRDPAGTALTTADGAKWSPLGTASSEHWGGGDADRINAAISWVFANGGGEVNIPTGTYVLTDTIVMRSGVTVRCAPGVVIDGNSMSADMLWFVGAVDAEHPLSAYAQTGSQTISAATADFEVGDLVHLVSQRNSLSRTDAGAWWCGDGTANSRYAYFAEFAVISEVLGGGQFRLSRPLIFPAYRTNNTLETQSERSTSTVKRVRPVKDAHWIGGKFVRTMIGASVQDSAWALQCSFADATIEQGALFGDSSRWRSSCDCVTKRVTVVNDPTLVWNYSTMHGKMNRFKIINSQDCGFDACSTTHAAQPVDFSFGASDGLPPTVNVRPYCRNGSFSACFEGLTSHAGSYEEEWIGNSVVDCFEDGLLVRGLRPTVRNNTFQRSYDPSVAGADQAQVGIGLAYGGFRGARVTGNTISGFPSGVYILDSATLDWQGRDLNVFIADNDIDQCRVGLWCSLRAWRGLRGINYVNNRHTRMGRQMVLIDSYSAGSLVRGNTLQGDFLDKTATSVMAVYIGQNNPAVSVVDNVWSRSKGGNAGQSRYMVFYGQVLDTTTYPAADFQSQAVISGNNATYSADLLADYFGGGAYPVT